MSSEKEIDEAWTILKSLNIIQIRLNEKDEQMTRVHPTFKNHYIKNCKERSDKACDDKDFQLDDFLVGNLLLTYLEWVGQINDDEEALDDVARVIQILFFFFHKRDISIKETSHTLEEWKIKLGEGVFIAKKRIRHS